MALTLAERKELDALRSELKPAQKVAKLSPAEAQELESLKAELGEDAFSQSQRVGGSEMVADGGVSGSQDESLGKGLLRTGLKALPAVGGIVGGIAGGIAGAPTVVGAPVAAVGGAALGTAAGESYKQLGENYFFGEKRTPEQAAKDVGMAGVEGAASQVVGAGIGKGLGLIGKTAPVKAVTGAIGRGAAKVGEALTGIPKKAIETYAKFRPEVAKMSKEAGGDVQVAADQLRAQFNKAIQGTRKALNAQLEKGLESNAGKQIQLQPILDDLAKQQEKINPKLYPEALEQIDDVMRKISSLGKEGKLDLKSAHEVKGYLQDLATGAYNKGGQIFQVGKDVAKAAKGAASTARKAVNAEAADVASANNQMANLHNIERGMNRGLLKEGETAASLMSAGSGANAKNIRHLKRLSDATGEDMVAGAEKLNAMKTFDDIPIMPWDYTGKAAGRIATGAGIGYLADGQEGAAVGAMLTSPLALKTAITGGRGLINAGGLLMSNPGSQNLMGRGLLNLQNYIRQRQSQGATPQQIEQELGAME